MANWSCLFSVSISQGGTFTQLVYWPHQNYFHSKRKMTMMKESLILLIVFVFMCHSAPEPPTVSTKKPWFQLFMWNRSHHSFNKTSHSPLIGKMSVDMCILITQMLVVLQVGCNKECCGMESFILTNKTNLPFTSFQKEENVLLLVWLARIKLNFTRPEIYTGRFLLLPNIWVIK